ncbi:MAG: hypothetical protein EOO40_11990, partial [Deltaproteobacteria bacterium]
MSVCSWAFSCTPHPDKIVISRIVIDMPATWPRLLAQRDALRDLLATRLRADASVEASPRVGSDSKAPGSRPGTHVLQVIWGPPSAPSLEVRLRPTRPGGAELATTVAIAGDPAQSQDALAAFDIAWATLGRMRALDRGSDKRMVQALRDDDAHLQQFAIVRLGERRARSAVKPLCKLLGQQTDTQMIYRIMGA